MVGAVLLTADNIDTVDLVRLSLSGVPITAPASLRPCVLYRDHGSAIPSFTEGHHRHPVYMQNEVYGGIRDPELLFVCSTCHDNIHGWLYYLTGKRRHPDPIPPPRARAEAERTLEWYLQHTGQ